MIKLIVALLFSLLGIVSVTTHAANVCCQNSVDPCQNADTNGNCPEKFTPKEGMVCHSTGLCITEHKVCCIYENNTACTNTTSADCNSKKGTILAEKSCSSVGSKCGTDKPLACCTFTKNKASVCDNLQKKQCDELKGTWSKDKRCNSDTNQCEDKRLSVIDKCDQPFSFPLALGTTSDTIVAINSMGRISKGCFLTRPLQQISPTSISNLISFPDSESTLQSVQLSQPYDLSNISIASDGASIQFNPFFEDNKTVNINFELDVPISKSDMILNLICPCSDLGVKLITFNAEMKDKEISLVWKVANKEEISGFRVWRSTNNNGLMEIYSLGLPVENNLNKDTKLVPVLYSPKKDKSTIANLITEVDDGNEKSTYSYIDTSILDRENTFYYVIEDVDYNGRSTFHCDQIDAVTIGQGPTIDLQSAVNYCKEVTGSND